MQKKLVIVQITKFDYLILFVDLNVVRVNLPLNVSKLKSGPKKVFPTSLLVVVCGVPYESGVGMPPPFTVSASIGVTTVSSSVEEIIFG